MKKSKKIIIVIAALLAVFCSGLLFTAFRNTEKTFDVCFAAVQDDLLPLFEARIEDYSDLVESYLEFYSLNFADYTDLDYEHFFGTFKSTGYTLAAHIFIPDNYKAAVTVMHGYFHHSGQLHKFVQYLLERNYAVAVFDMPGHGLSTGARGDIASFGDYSAVLDTFAGLVSDNLDSPYYFVGQSTGGAIAIEHIFSDAENHFDKVVLIAPLVRSYRFGYSKFMFRLTRPFVRSIPRSYAVNTTDRQLLHFLEHIDPLQVRKVPLGWFNALIEWNQRFENFPQSDKEILVVQGDIDTTVDWEHNIEAISQKFENAKIVIIEDGRHILLNEGDEIREKVFDIIDEYFKGGMQ